MGFFIALLCVGMIVVLVCCLFLLYSDQTENIQNLIEKLAIVGIVIGIIGFSGCIGFSISHLTEYPRSISAYECSDGSLFRNKTLATQHEIDLSYGQTDKIQTSSGTVQ